MKKVAKEVKVPDEVLKRAWIAGVDGIRLYCGLPPEDGSHMWNAEKLSGMQAAAQVILGWKSGRKSK